VDRENRGLAVSGRAFGRFATADLEIGGRAELELRVGDRTAALFGGGYRAVGALESGGVVPALRAPPVSGATTRGDIAPWVPRFEEEADAPLDPSGWRTQLGTGFREGTFDGRVVHELGEDLELVAAVYGYRQYDAPRADQCPPPEAPIDECLRVEEQFRTLGYAALRGDAGPDMEDLSIVFSVQQHHEVRARERPRSHVRLDWRDEVLTVGLAFAASTRSFEIGDESALRLRYGVDAARDGVDASHARQRFTDIGREFPLARGQYLPGSLYVMSGAFVDAELLLWPWLVLRAGARGTMVGVRAPADPESGSVAIRRELGTVVGRGAVEIRAGEAVRVMLNVDQGFRAPNLDDLTSRQQTGAGFQFENAFLEPERTLTWELGAALELEWIVAEGWIYVTFLDGAIVRAVREAEDCPAETPECRASRNQFQLVNAPEGAVVLGGEGGVTFFLPEDVTARATVSAAWGEGPNTGARPGDPAASRARVPLSRIPPLNGTVEGRWRHPATGLYAAAAMRWAAAQTRLAPSDASDARIPAGGTREYAVFDLRAGWRYARFFRLSVVFENVFDAAWRAHGSSVNGPGRGLVVELMGGF
jgi:iron complex outermembrane receptor protein/hemoglobin/transferrin/lactoferrin receptor protein